MADDLAAMHRFVRVERSIDVSVRIDLAPAPDDRSETIAAPWKKPRRQRGGGGGGGGGG